MRTKLFLNQQMFRSIDCFLRDSNVVIFISVSASAKSEAVPQEGRNYFPIDESGDDEAGFRLPRLIQDQEKGEDLGAVIVQSSPPGGRDLDDNLKPTGFSFPQDHSAPNKAGFRLPPAAIG